MDLGMLSGSRTFSVPVEVTDSMTAVSAQPVLENVRANVTDVPRNTEFEVFADIFNGPDRISDAVLTVNSGSSQLARRFIGTIEANAITHDNPLLVPGFAVSGEQRLTVTLSYTSKGEAFNVSRNVTVRVTEPVIPVHPVLENLRLSDSEIVKGAPFEVFVDIFNGTHGITNAALTVSSGGVQLARRFIGGIEGGSIIPENMLSASGINFTGHQDLTVTLSYFDKDGSAMSVSRNISVRVTDNSGLLNLQNISAPLRADLDNTASVNFWLTNPTAVAVTGIEAFLYDDNGRQLTSIYISEIPPNFSALNSLEFPVTGRAGTRIYSLNITYTGAADIRQSINGSFSINIAAAAAEDTERDAVLRIQRIDAPSLMNTGVRTKIPFTLVNAGRGMAYNVEVFVLNEQGVEIMREFVGNIAPGISTFDTSFLLRLDEAGDYNLTFYAVGENADESLTQASRVFEQQVVNYRVTITDVGGHEWIWNNMTSIEFSVINGGSEIMHFVGAELVNARGDVLSTAYIGNILPEEKKERQRFRDVYIWDNNTGSAELLINLTYENSDKQEHLITLPITATFQSDGGFIPPPPDDPYGPFVEEKPFPWLAVLLFSMGVLTVGGIIFFIVFKTKKKVRDEDDDIDYFLSQMNTGTAPSSRTEDKEEINA
jgi:hypothetical protein